MNLINKEHFEKLKQWDIIKDMTDTENNKYYLIMKDFDSIKNNKQIFASIDKDFFFGFADYLIDIANQLEFMYKQEKIERLKLLGEELNENK